MPTPVEILLDPVSLIALGMYAGLMTWERLVPGACGLVADMLLFVDVYRTSGDDKPAAVAT